MRRIAKISAWGAALIATVVVLAVLAVFVATNSDWGREQLRTRVVSMLNGFAHGQVRIARISGNLLREVTLHDVSITDSSGAPFVTAKSLQVNFKLFALISQKIDLSDLRAEQAVVVLDKRPNAAWNYDRIFPVDSGPSKGDTAGIQFGDWVVLHNATLIDSRVTVRAAWEPDPKLPAAVRDSMIKAALDTNNRTVTEKVNGGYQRVQDFRELNGRLPLIRIAQPDHRTRLIEVDSLRTTAFAFAPPAAEVRQAKGVFEIDSDSVWFNVTALELAASQASLTGRYTIDNGDMWLKVNGKSIALADVRFIYPPLPTEGHATFDLALNWVGPSSDYMVKRLDLKTGGAIITGDVGITVKDTVQWNQTNVKFSGVTTALIEHVVPSIHPPRKGTLAGRARLNGPLTDMHIDGDVSFVDAMVGLNRVVASGNIGVDSNVFRAKALHVEFNPVQINLAQDAMKDLPVHGVVTGSAIVDGASDQLLRATRIDLIHVDRGERSRIVGEGSYRAGTKPFIALNANAQPLSLVTLGRFAPTAELRGSVSGPMRVSGTTDALNVDIALTSADSGLLSAKGVIDVASKDIGYDAEIVTKLLNARVLTEKAPRTSLSATLSAKGKGFDPATMYGVFAANVSTSTIDTLAVDSSRVLARIEAGVVNVDAFAVRVPGASADVQGTFGLTGATSGTLTYKIKVDSAAKLARYLPTDTTTVFPRPAIVAERLMKARADSARIAQKLMVARAAGVAAQASPIAVETPPAIASDSISGTALIEGQLTGNIESLDAKGKARVENVVALGNTVVRAHADYTAKQVLTDKSLIDVTLSGDSISAAGFALDSVAAHVTYQSTGGDARIAIYQNTARDYSVNAKYAIFPDSKEIRFDTLALRFDSTRWSAKHSASVKWGQPGIAVDSVDLTNGKGGRLFADGKLPSEGVSDFRASVVDFEVGDLMGLLQSDLAARGMLSVDAKITGASSAPSIAGSASYLKGTFDNLVVPELKTTFNYANKLLGAKANATFDGREVAVVDASVPMNLAITGVTGSRLLDGSSTINVKTDSLPLDLASRFTETVADVRGFVIGVGSLRGPIRKPTITGDVHLTNAQMRVTDLGVLFTRVNGGLRMRGDTLMLDSLTAYSGGKITLAGSLGISKPATPSFDLTLAADNAQVLDNQTGDVRADAQITIKGPFDGVAVNGRARIREGVLYIPKPDTREVIVTSDAVVTAATDSSTDASSVLVAPSPLMANLKMNLRLGVDRDTWVRSKEANVEVYSDGDLRIVVDQKRSALTLEGVVNSDRGEYEFMSKRFQIKRGSVTFVGTGAIDPLLQLTGEYELKQAAQQALKIRVLIGGTMLAPRLTLESDAQPPISQSDLLSYLAFGSESGSLLQFGGSSVSGGTAGGGLVGTSAALATKQLAGVALGIAVDEVEGRAARSLGADVFNITPANIPPELASSNIGTLTTFFKGTQLEFGKYFTTQTFVGLQLQATTTPGFRVEHRFNKHPGLSLESTLQPRFFLPEPSLEPGDLKKANAFGLFLVRRWRF